MAGWAGVLLGAWAGPVLAGAERATVSANLASCWLWGAPVLLAGAAMAAALAVSERPEGGSRA